MMQPGTDLENVSKVIITQGKPGEESKGGSDECQTKQLAGIYVTSHRHFGVEEGDYT